MSAKSIVNHKHQINIVLHDEQSNRLQQKQTTSNSPLYRVDEFFSAFIGLDHIKQCMKEIYALKLINDERKQYGLVTETQVLHMIFTGNPGTGKTTIARQIAKLCVELNILTKGQFIEAERADVVGEYIGQTAQKTRNLVQRALGGVLFIDEAYSLARGGHKDFGREAIDTLVKQMEDYADQFMLILAGYPTEMDYFLQMNPGLASRFPFIHSFKDYSIDELMQIGEHFIKERHYKLTKEAKWTLKHYIRQQMAQEKQHFANARVVRNIIEKAIRAQALRLVNDRKVSYNDLLYIDVDDFHFNHRN